MAGRRPQSRFSYPLHGTKSRERFTAAAGRAIRVEDAAPAMILSWIDLDPLKPHVRAQQIGVYARSLGGGMVGIEEHIRNQIMLPHHPARMPARP